MTLSVFHDLSMLFAGASQLSFCKTSEEVFELSSYSYGGSDSRKSGMMIISAFAIFSFVLSIEEVSR